MLPSPKKPRGKSVSPELDVQKMPQSTVAAETAALSNQNVITCPKCLRPNKLEAMSLDGGIHQTICQSCRTPVKFEINHEIAPLMKPKRA
jgi:hypothetical protein